MKLTIFIDADNFKANIRCINTERKQNRVLDFHRLNTFVLDYLSKNLQYKNSPLTHIRTYYYTGEYTDSLFKKIKDAIEKSSGHEQERFTQILQKTIQRKESQNRFLKKSDGFYFFEVRKKPLQFSMEKGVFQKGVDVQLAVDLVSNAHLNTYDIAVLFSGDIDLLESVRSVKNLGKHVIIFSHYTNIAREMMKESDFFVDLQRFDDNQLNQFTHPYKANDDINH